jgi:hypothetical protein
MAEIKSTLDLVMERTRHLTMSDSDKRDQAAGEFKTALNVLIQKYLDKDIDTDKFREQLLQLEKRVTFSDKGMVIGEIGRRIDPGTDNRLLLDLLQSASGVSVSGIRILLKECAQTVDKQAETARERIKGDLKNEGISGSAVVPNLDSDEGWVIRRNEITEQCRESLQTEIRRLALV